MIVLDEQLLGRNLELDIARWYRGAVQFISDIVCFTLPDSRANEISQALRSLLRHPELKTKAKRMGKIIRVTDREISYYTPEQRGVRKISNA
jgi:hypothetical protein